jgi:glutathione S-transferase
MASLVLLVGGSEERDLVPTKLEYSKQQATENAKEEVKRILGLLDTHLKTRTFLVGERVTLADITVVCTLLWLYKQVRFISHVTGVRPVLG